MDYPNQLDRLLTELHEAQSALAVADYHIRSWSAQSASENVSCRRRLHVAHEALYEADKLIDHIAERLRIQAYGTLATQQGQCAQIYTAGSPTDTGRGAPVGQPLAECS